MGRSGRNPNHFEMMIPVLTQKPMLVLSSDGIIRIRFQLDDWDPVSKLDLTFFFNFLIKTKISFNL